MSLPIRAVPEGGFVGEGLNSLSEDALNRQKKRLENQFYQPNIESEIALRKAQTEHLPFENELLKQQAKWFGPNTASEINQRNALATTYPFQNAQTKQQTIEQQIKNKYLDESEKKRIATMGMGRLGTGGAEENLFQSLVQKDNPQLTTPEQVYEASNVLRAGGNTLLDGTVLNPMSEATKSSHDRLSRGRTSSALATQAIKANQADAELKVIDNEIEPLMKRYGTTYFGFSPQQIADSMSSDPKKQQDLGDFMAAQTAQYEAAQIRNRIAQGESGITATQEMMGRSGQIINTRWPRQSAEARERAVKKLDEILEKALKARQSVGVGASQLFGSNIDMNNPKQAEEVRKNVNTTLPSSSEVMTYNPKTGRLE